MRYIFLGQRHARMESGRIVNYVTGDTIELTEREVARFAPGTVKPAKEAAASRKAILRTVDRPKEGGDE